MTVFTTFIGLILVSPILAGNRCYTRPEVKLIAKGHNAFARNFYQVVANQSNENIFFSPFSIATAFGILHMGARGNTATELKNVFHYSDDIASIRRGYNDLMTEFQSEKSRYTLKSVNKIYVQQEFSLLDNFTSATRNDFLSAAENVDFSESEEIRQNINSFVEEATNSKIKELFPRGSINSLTSLVLVNALYFKSAWSTQFFEELTENLPFWVTNDSSVNMPMMRSIDDYYYKENEELNAKILKLTYRGEACSFVVILPNKRDGLGELESKLNNVSLESLDDFSYQPKRNVDVKIPKFKLEEKLNLPFYLNQLGLVDAFDDGTADLSGIAGTDNLYVTAAHHKAFVEINENGTEAAAATGISMGLTSLPLRTYNFTADHPFLFYIKHERSNSILFIGRFLKNPGK